MKARTLTSLALVGIGVSSLGAGAGCSAPDVSNLHEVSKMEFTVRSEMDPGNYWGGWTDGTVQYIYDDTNPPIPESIVKTMWGGQMLITTIRLDEAQKHPEFDDASFQLLATSENLPAAVKANGLNGVLHVQGQGWTAVGGQFSYDANGAGEDLTDYAEGGVVFFAKAGTNPDAPVAATLGFSSPDFSPVALAAGAPPDTSAHCGNSGYNGCYDAPSVSVALRPFWRQFVIPFRAMRQAGYGYAVTDFFEKRGLASVATPTGAKGPLVQFLVPKNAPFDFWIAALGFYKKADHDKVFPY